MFFVKIIQIMPCCLYSCVMFPHDTHFQSIQGRQNKLSELPESPEFKNQSGKSSLFQIVGLSVRENIDHNRKHFIFTFMKNDVNKKLILCLTDG